MLPPLKKSILNWPAAPYENIRQLSHMSKINSMVN